VAQTFAFGEAVVTIRGDMRELAAALGQSRGLVDDFKEEAKSTSQQAVSSFQAIDGAVAVLNGVLVAAAKKAGQLADSWMYAAGRLETLEISLQNVGKMAGYSEDELFKYRDAIKAAGIETKGATQATIAFVTSQLDVSKAAKVARVAQDLAVIAGTDSTQMFNRLTQAISMQRPILLRAAGITTGLTEIYAKFSEETGIAVKAMDAQMKKTAMLNFILEYGERAFGTYESAMGSAYKQMGSMTRYAEEMKNVFGEHLQPVFMAQVSAQKLFYKTMVDLHPVLQGTIALTMKLGSVAVAAVAGIKALSLAIPYLTGGMLTLTGALGILASTVLPLILAIGALTAIYVIYKKRGEEVTAMVERQEERMASLARVYARGAEDYEEYIAKMTRLAIEAGKVPYQISSNTEEAMKWVRLNLAMTVTEFNNLRDGIVETAQVARDFSEGMLSSGENIKLAAETEVEAQKDVARWAEYATSQRLAGLAKEWDARKKDQAQAKKWAKAMSEVFEKALDSAAEYEEERVALAGESDQAIVELAAQFDEERTLAQARHHQNLAQLEAQWQADRTAAAAAGDMAELQKIDATYQQELAKRQASWANRTAMDRQEHALDLARLAVANAQKAHANEVARLEEITALKKQMAEKFAIEFMASDDWLKMSQSARKVFMAQMDANFGLRLSKEALYAEKSMAIANELAQGIISTAESTARLELALAEATDEALVTQRAKDAQAAIEAAQANLAALVNTYGIAATVLPDYTAATIAAGAATGGMAEQTETAVTALERVVSSLKGVATEAMELVTEVIGFELPKGFREGFQNIADAMVEAVQVVYDAWQRGEGKARKAGEFADHVRKIFEGMQAAADFMRQSERPAKLVAEAVARVAEFIDLSVAEMGKMADKYEEEGLLHMERFGLAVQSIVGAMGAAFGLMQAMPRARMVEAAPEELFTFMDSLVQGLKKIALPVDLGDLAKLRMWSEAMEAILSPIQTAIDVATKLAGYERISGLGAKVRAVMDGVDEILGAMLGALAPWGTHEMYSVDALRRLIERQVELINVWAMGVSALNNAIGPAVDVVKKLADYETPENLADKVAQVMLDVGEIFDAVMDALAPWGTSEYYPVEGFETIMARVAQMMNAWNEALGPLSSAIRNAVEMVNALSTYTRVQNIREKVARLVSDIDIIMQEFNRAFEEGLGLAEEAAENATEFAEQMGDIVSIVTDGLDAIAALQDYTAAGAGFELRVQAFLDDLVRIVSVFADEEHGLPAFPALLLPIVEDFATGFRDVASIVKDGLDVIAGLRDYVKTGSDFATRTQHFIEDAWTVVEMFRDNLEKFPAELAERAELFRTGFEHIASIISMGVDAISDLVNMPGVQNLDDQTDTFLSALFGSAKPAEEGGLMGILPKFDLYLIKFTDVYPDLADRARQFADGFVVIAKLIDDGIGAITALVEMVDTRTLDDRTDEFLSALMGPATAAGAIPPQGIISKFDYYLANLSQLTPDLVERARTFNTGFHEINRLIAMGLDAIAMITSIPDDLNLGDKLDAFLDFIRELKEGFDELWGLGKSYAEESSAFERDMSSVQGNINKAMNSIQYRDYTRVGKRIVEDIALGIKMATSYALAPALKTISDMLPHSPARIGPLSEPVDWEGYLTSGLGDALREVGMTPGMSMTAGRPAGTMVNMNVLVESGASIDTYRTAAALANAIEQQAGSRGMNITRLGYRR